MNELIERYRRAYVGANDGEECPEVQYRGRGWYKVSGVTVRRPKLEQIIHQLEWRAEGDEMKYGDVLLYPNHRTLAVDGCWEHLTPMMSKLLAYLMAHPGQLLSLGTLMRQIWETEYVGDMRTIHVHVCWLRRALGEDRRYLIQTVRGVGYRFGGKGEGSD